MSPSSELAPILNRSGCVQSSPSSSFIKESHVRASLALRIPPAGLKPTLWPVCYVEKKKLKGHRLQCPWTVTNNLSYNILKMLHPCWKFWEVLRAKFRLFTLIQKCWFLLFTSKEWHQLYQPFTSQCSFL